MVKKLILIVISLAVIFGVIGIIIKKEPVHGSRCEMLVAEHNLSRSSLEGNRFTLIMDNSGSMKGYMDFASKANAAEFRDAKRTAISTLSAILDNVASATGVEPVTICGGKERGHKAFITAFQNSTLFGGQTTQLSDMMGKAAEMAGDSAIVGIFTDMVLSAGKKATLQSIDYNKHHLEDLKGEIYSVATQLRDKGLDVSIVRYLSDFNGSYYYNYQENRSDSLIDRRMKDRPYYLMLIGKADILNALTTQCLKLDGAEMFSTMCDEMPHYAAQPFSIQETKPWLIGTPDTASAKHPVTLWTTADLGEEQSKFTITFDKIDIPSYASTDLRAEVITSETVMAVNKVSDTEWQLVLQPFDQLPEHGEVSFNLVSDKILWADDTRSMEDDCDIKISEMEGRTWGLSNFIAGISEAYKIDTTPYVSAKFELNVSKK